MRKLLLPLLAALLLCACATSGVRSRDLEIDLGDGFTAKAQLTYPSSGDGPWPTVILFHGSGPWDMDATFSADTQSANFKLLAERLGSKGIAVLRFNKRGVLGYGKYDQAQVMKAITNRLIGDAAAVIAAARALPEVDRGQLYLYGWSQGAQVAAHAAARDSEIAGLVLQGAPTSGWPEILKYQHVSLGLPFLKEQGDRDRDGKLSPAEFARLPYGPAALMGSFYVWAPDSSPMAPKLRPEVDRNSDGLVEIETELRPAIEALIQDPSASGNPFLNPDSEPTVTVAEAVSGLKLRVLLLHGEADGWVPVADGEKVAAAAGARATLKRYPSLGHALSPTKNPATDSFGPMAEEPIRDLITWILTRG